MVERMCTMVPAAKNKDTIRFHVDKLDMKAYDRGMGFHKEDVM